MKNLKKISDITDYQNTEQFNRNKNYTDTVSSGNVPNYLNDNAQDVFFGLKGEKEIELYKRRLEKLRKMMRGE